MSDLFSFKFIEKMFSRKPKDISNWFIFHCNQRENAIFSFFRKEIFAQCYFEFLSFERVTKGNGHFFAVQWGIGVGWEA